MTFRNRITPLLGVWTCLWLAACAGGDEEAQTPTPDNSGTNNATTNNQNNSDGTCERDIDCNDGQFCDNGVCIDAECTRDADCEVGFICRIDSGICVEPECLRNSDCGDGEFCDRVERKCKEGCGSNGDCEDNQVCNPNTNACEDNNECEQDGDCGDKQVCTENKCINVECVVDAHCTNPGEVCDTDQNKCRVAEGFCATDADCAADEKCDADTNACVKVSEGCTDDSCPEGTECNEASGECWACATDADCAEGQICDLNTHTCQDTGCTSDADCANGQICNRVSGDCEDAQTCQPDSFEPNNATDSAALIGDGQFRGLRICEADEDWFAFQVGAGASLELTATFTNASGNLDLELLDPNGARFGVSTSNSDTERIFAENLPLSGAYKLRVYGVDGAQNDYQLAVVLTENQNPTCTDDGFEENDAATAAAPIAAQSFDNLQVCPGDPDYFKVRVEAGERLRVQAAFTQANGDLDVTILAPNGQDVIARGLSDTDNEDVETDPVAVSGDYVVAVAGVDPSVSNTYGLALSKRGEPQNNDCTDDSLEQNDGREQAANVAPGLVSALHVCPGDEDWYAIGLNAGDDLRVQLTFTHAEGDLDLLVYQPGNPDPIAESRSRSDGEDAGVSRVATSGVYLVRVVGADPEQANDYTMLVERTTLPNETCEDDAQEDNDNISQPRRLTTDATSGQICSGDEDWYSVHVNAGGSLSALLTFDGAEGDLDLEILSPGGQSLGVSSGVEDSEILDITTINRSGEYLIRVYGFLGAEASYDLDLLVGESPCFDDDQEENDDRANAALVEPAAQAGLTVCSNDEDWYAVELAAGDGLTATLFFTGGDLDLQIVDEQGLVLASSIAVQDNEEATVAAVPAAGLYYVRVYGFLGAEADYELNLEQLGGGAQCLDDRQEPNDSQARPRVLSGSTTLNDLHLCPSDNDWYAVELQEREILDVQLAFSNADGDIDMEVLDPNGAVLRQSLSVQDAERVQVRAVLPGVYFVRVFSIFEDVDNAYSMTLDVLPPDTCLDDEFEVNDVQDDAASITEGTYLGLGLCKPDGEDESDWYAIFLSELDILSVLVLFEHDNGDLDLRLYDSNGDELQDSSTFRDSEFFEHLAETDDFYLIEVRGFTFFGGEINTEYDMLITLD